MDLSRQSLIDKIQGKVTTIEDFNYDKLTAPPLYSLLTQQDIDRLYYIATSVKYSSKPEEKYKAIDNIMRARGFVKLSAGTNRVVYRHLESNAFVVKVAADAIGIGDNPKEFKNQFIFKPFVTKVFEVSPCGTVGVFERVQPIKSREEFLSAADDIFDVINEWFIGKYIMADIGTKFFMNWGIRTYSTGKEGSVAFGPVLLDFPYAYELDGNKLFCSAVDHNSETGLCGGVIDYDDGFNFLVCTKCGVRYLVKELSKKIENNEIKIISNTGREIKKMKIGRYDENGNVVVDNNIIKPAVSKVERTVEKKEIKTGKIGIDPEKLKAFAQSTPVNVKPEVENHTIKNSLRDNPANNRGIVKAPASSNIKIDLKPAEEEIAKAENKEYNLLLEYDAEHNIMVLSNGDNEITATMDVVPDEFMQTAIENSAEYTEYLSGINKIKSLEEQLAEKDTKIGELESAVANKPEIVEADDKIITELQAKVADLEKQLEEAQTNKTIVANGIPRVYNPEYVEINADDFGDAVAMDGKVDNIKYFTTPKNDSNKLVVVFPTDEENGEYCTDGDGHIIVVATINGYPIDELMAKVVDEEIVVTDETKEDNKEE